MSKFKTRPASLRALPDDTEVAAFTSGASTKKTEVRPWDGLDPNAKPTSGINLRLNDYELALIRYVAASEDRSLQKIIKRKLIPALEAEVERLMDEP